MNYYTKYMFFCIVKENADTKGAAHFMGMGGTIFWAVIIAVILIVPMFYTIKKGYSRKWDEE
ncbi:hypothetical protein [Paenibacillus lemnae]|uniref:Uncharacterized protein n=1 Tax=Paenibacillus lemnae TaxID=1330551 RepID=A0A848M1H0_PAELE|nr:hypothetical protein [Paenibacillus lemnae]NMO94707.1 hypothetical protein [Paenibacillus lemnae]